MYVCAAAGTSLRFDRAVLLRTREHQRGGVENVPLRLPISVIATARLAGCLCVHSEAEQEPSEILSWGLAAVKFPWTLPRRLRCGGAERAFGEDYAR